MYKILSVNPGSTSTKIGVYEDETQLFEETIRHTVDELKKFQHISDQYDFRKNIVLTTLQSKGLKINELNASVGRGGFLRSMQSGVYEVDQKMLDDLKSAAYGEHASNLGALIAYEIARTIPGCRAFIADPIVIDEMQDVARISGLPQMPRRSVFHALNQKAVARKYAKQIGKPYESLNLVVAHLGGGISVSAHRLGKVVDTNQALGGYGPLSPERAGTVDACELVSFCFNSGYSQSEIKKLLLGQGGLVAHLGNNNVSQLVEQAESGDEKVALLLNAMSYTIAKEIGSMLVVLEGKADAVLITGGIAHNPFIVDYIRNMISSFSPVIIFPGEDELEALAMSGLKVLRGEKALVY